MALGDPQATAATPAISVVMPVYNGAPFLERSIRSVRAQTFADWELLAVDDGSTDDSYAHLCRHAAADPRIRPLRLARNQGPSAARNAALRPARAATIAYLDCDDEYFPDYLGQVHAWHAQADVLVFAYEIAEPHPRQPGAIQIRTYDAAPVRRRLMDGCIVIPLGVAHHRRLLHRTGLFDDTKGFFFEEDLDLWQRLGRVGAEFLFLPLKSGRYYIRPDSLSRTRHRLRTQAENHRAAGAAAAAPGNPPGQRGGTSTPGRG